MATKLSPTLKSVIGLSPDRIKALTGVVSVKLSADSDLGRWLDVQKIKIVSRVSTFQCEVTPQIASAWLKFNEGNRQPSEAKIKRFAAAIKTHRWAVNGETVKFSVSGRLLDGQSRLRAIVLAGVPAVLEVRAGLPDVAQESMDSGEVRKGSHTLEMLGEKYPNELAAALRLVYIHENGGKSSEHVMENGDVKTFLQKHAALKLSVGWCVVSRSRINNLMPISEAAYFHYQFTKASPSASVKFFESLVDGVDLTKESPVYQLRERLIAERLATKRINKRDRHILIVKAWNAHKRGEKLSSLIIRTGEAMPVIDGLKLAA
jgi:hypothetical protein